MRALEIAKILLTSFLFAGILFLLYQGASATFATAPIIDEIAITLLVSENKSEEIRLPSAALFRDLVVHLQVDPTRYSTIELQRRLKHKEQITISKE